MWFEARLPLISVATIDIGCLAAMSRTRGCGLDAYLAKPVALERLRAALERWLPIDAGHDDARNQHTSSRAAIDVGVLTSWLGNDRMAIGALLGRSRRSHART